MEITLYDHNRTAYLAALDQMNRTGKTAVIHPTGTGKSFIGFRLCADNPEWIFLWLSPSEYIFKTQLDNLRTATGGEVPENITFCTYQKLLYMGEPEMAGLGPDCIILDEFHRCGARMWGQGVQKLLDLFPDAKILGLSATNIRYLDNNRDMADELFDGNIASEISLGEAIVRGILHPPRYVLSVYSVEKGLKKYEKRIRGTRNRAVRDECERILEELRRALEMSEGLEKVFARHMTDRTGKYIVFCSSKEHMDEMMGHLEWFAQVDPHPKVYSLFSEDPGAGQAFDDFRRDEDDTHLRLLYCIDALNEGIHMEGISGVILLRPTVSPIVYKQQIGRALSAGSQKDTVIFDVVMNVDNLDSIGEVEEEMQLVTSYYRSFGKNESIVHEHFQIWDEVRDCRKLFHKLNDTLTASWDCMFGYAQAYYRENGSLNMPSRYMTEDGYPLGRWIYTQKYIRRGIISGSLTQEQIRKLDSIGMVWESMTDLAWEKNYTAAKRYRETHGHLLVPAEYETEDGVCLGSWIGSLRSWEKAGARQKYLTPERIRMLDDLGMVWDVSDYYWERNYAAAARYYGEHHHLNVPRTYVTEDGIRLGSWLYRIYSLRKGIGKGVPPTREQIRRLDAIGMDWSARAESKWQNGCREAEIYVREHGNLRVPVKYVTETGFPLGSWIQRQRAAYKKGTLLSERRSHLEKMGMVWQADSWEDRFALVKAWQEENETPEIPQDTVVNGVWIGKWYAAQKKNRTLGKLTGRQEALLDTLPRGQTSRKEAAWLLMYQDAADFAGEHGSLRGIPSDYQGKSGRRLGHWLTLQRKAKREGKLSEAQYERLDAIGMVWKVGS
ncbi:MAG: Helicase associated domain protein [Clostridiales bacterium]|nr:Helicase associated domain protein [Clostridiales bacterium]